MAVSDEVWQPARIIPVTGLAGADEQERRGCSAFLAVLGSVREFGRAITATFGAPAGVIETFIEVPFKLGDTTYRPDGLIRVRRGQRHWVALVEVKTGRNVLIANQIGAYVDIAREQNFDAVVTISNEIPTTPGVHPVSVEKKKLRKVTLHHLSWSRIHTEALIERLNHSVSDPVQSWILTEFIRYLEYPKSGALDFDDMGPAWVSVREASSKGTLRLADQGTLDVVARFDQLVAFAGMQLASTGKQCCPDLGVALLVVLRNHGQSLHLLGHPSHSALRRWPVHWPSSSPARRSSRLARRASWSIWTMWEVQRRAVAAALMRMPGSMSAPSSSSMAAVARSSKAAERAR